MSRAACFFITEDARNLGVKPTTLRVDIFVFVYLIPHARNPDLCLTILRRNIYGFKQEEGVPRSLNFLAQGMMIFRDGQ